MQSRTRRVIAPAGMHQRQLYHASWYVKRIFTLNLAARLPALLVGGFVCLAAAGCSIATHTADAEAMASLTFENATIDPVTVYLDQAGSRLILGHVEPGRQARLRIPEFASLRNRADVRVVVVPLGADRDGSRAGNTATAVCSELEPAPTGRRDALAASRSDAGERGAFSGREMTACDCLTGWMSSRAVRLGVIPSRQARCHPEPSGEGSFSSRQRALSGT